MPPGANAMTTRTGDCTASTYTCGWSCRRSDARQQLPHLTAADVGVLENLIRESLEDLASKGAA